MFLAVVLTGLTVTATQMDFGNGSLTRVSCCIDKGCNAVTDCRAYLKPVPAGHGSVKICSAFAVDQWRKVLLLLLFLRRGNALFVHFKRIAGVSNWPLTICFRLLGKVWPVGGPLLVKLATRKRAVWRRV